MMFRRVEWKLAYYGKKIIFGIREPGFKSCLYHLQVVDLGRSLKTLLLPHLVCCSEAALRVGQMAAGGSGGVSAA